MMRAEVSDRRLAPSPLLRLPPDGNMLQRRIIVTWAGKSETRAQTKIKRWYRGAEVPRSLIRRFARAVAHQFRPDKIILFGSQAYGRPHVDSDVDLMVVMPT